MAASIVTGQRSWSMQRDKDGHRDYKITHRVRAAITDGPFVVSLCTGLPAIGSTWSFDSDVDPYAYCWPNMTITPVVKNEPNQDWDVEQKFSTKPFNRCQDASIEDPTLEPQKVSGSFVRHVKQIHEDRNGTLMKYSSHEPITGPIVEFNDSRPTVRIEQNRASLELDTITEMRDTVNDATLWGLSARCILLAGISWERLFYGTCDCYWKRIFEFEIDFGGHDRRAPDYGTMVLKGNWINQDTDPEWEVVSGMDHTNPCHFQRFLDPNGEPGRILLNGYGRPVTGEGTGTGTADDVAYIDIEYYDESDFLELGIPAVLESCTI